MQDLACPLGIKHGGCVWGVLRVGLGLGLELGLGLKLGLELGLGLQVPEVSSDQC